MLIRFFNDWGLAGEKVLLIGIATPTADRGEAREAVRVATAEDVEHYSEAYQAYVAALEPTPMED
jgi:hypothetical protein